MLVNLSKVAEDKEASKLVRDGRSYGPCLFASDPSTSNSSVCSVFLYFETPTFIYILQAIRI